MLDVAHVTLLVGRPGRHPMPCVRLDYEPIVLLATADTDEAEPRAEISILTDAKLSYLRDGMTITFVDVEATLMLFTSAKRSQVVRVVVERAGRRERMTGILQITDAGKIQADLIGSAGAHAVLRASGLRSSDWRESTAA